MSGASLGSLTDKYRCDVQTEGSTKVWWGSSRLQETTSIAGHACLHPDNNIPFAQTIDRPEFQDHYLQFSNMSGF
jgi:hypothetical protein